MGHSSRKKKRERRLRKEQGQHHGYHPPVYLNDPVYHQCRYWDPKECDHCPHGEPHLVVPVEGLVACGGLCAHRDIQTMCVPMKNFKGPV